MRWLPRTVVTRRGLRHADPRLSAPHANLLRLWRAEAAESFDFEAFNVGDYYGAVDQKVASETISKVLYPNDEPEAGKQLRLEQQYFFVSCSLQDMIRLHLLRGVSLDEFDECWAVQLNDTHPSIAVAELMRLLVDEHELDWEQAWAITRRACAYTNHTLLPEALEKWPLPLFGTLLPRHLEIIYEINRRFLDDVRLRHPGDDQLRRAAVARSTKAARRYVRMAHLAAVGSHAINGVAALHTELLKQTVLQRLLRAWPGEVLQRDQRRDAAPLDRAEQSAGWRAHHQPHRRRLDRRSRDELPRLEPLAGDAGFQRGVASGEGAPTSATLPRLIAERTGVVVRSRRRCSTSRSSGSTNTSAST